MLCKHTIMKQKGNTHRAINKKTTLESVVVVMDGIEPPTQGFSILCSTN